MQLTPELIEKIAKLARLNLTPAEKEKYTQQLATILEYTEKLKQLDVTGVPLTNQVAGLKNVTRKDKVTSFPEQERLLKLSPNPLLENQIRVSKSI